MLEQDPDLPELDPRLPGKIAQLCATMGIGEWDIILLGDGSGSTWLRESAWACVSYEKTKPPRLWYGYLNRGSNNVAEAMAYVHALMALKNEADAAGIPWRQVHIITDSQYVASMASHAVPRNGANSLLWQAFASLRRQGWVLTWHWSRRNETPVQQLVDELSKRVRTATNALFEGPDGQARGWHYAALETRLQDEKTQAEPAAG